MEWNGMENNKIRNKKKKGGTNSWNSMEQKYGTRRKRLEWNGMKKQQNMEQEGKGWNRGENTEQSINRTLVC